MRKLAAALVLALTTVVLGVGGASSQVEAAWSDCPSPGYFCAWSGTGWSADSSGAWAAWFYDSSNWPGAGGYLDGGIENNDSSMRNSSTGQRVRVFKYQGYGTFIYCVPKGISYSNLNASGKPYDQGSSHVWNTGNC